jgi:hypothetical protein
VGRPRAEDGREVDVEAAELCPCARAVGRMKVGDRIAVSRRAGRAGRDSRIGRGNRGC